MPFHKGGSRNYELSAEYCVVSALQQKWMQRWPTPKWHVFVNFLSGQKANSAESCYALLCLIEVRTVSPGEVCGAGNL